MQLKKGQDILSGGSAHALFTIRAKDTHETLRFGLSSEGTNISGVSRAAFQSVVSKGR